MNSGSKRALRRRQQRQRQLEERLRMAFDALPWQMSTVCSDCDRFVVCGGYSRWRMRCLSCFSKTRAAREHARGKGNG